MSPPGRPKGSDRSAQHEGIPMSPPGRPKGSDRSAPHEGTPTSPPIEVYLNPGDHFVGDARHRVHTLLGSCVSIVLWHQSRRVGAMSHFVLAEVATRAEGELDGRYGTHALQLMTTRLAAFGVDVRDCQAKLFGGGDMFPDPGRAGDPPVGRRNGESARAMLLAHGISLTSESLFGTGHRRIFFDIATGDVWARQAALSNIHGSLA